jgi:hypothetical protein
VLQEVRYKDLVAFDKFRVFKRVSVLNSFAAFISQNPAILNFYRVVVSPLAALCRLAGRVLDGFCIELQSVRDVGCSFSLGLLVVSLHALHRVHSANIGFNYERGIDNNHQQLQ